MDIYHMERIVREANMALENGATIREISNKIGVSKSTVHRDLNVCLPQLNNELYQQTRLVLDKNMAERHLRGGESTKQKWKSVKDGKAALSSAD